MDGTSATRPGFPNKKRNRSSSRGPRDPSHLFPGPLKIKRPLRKLPWLDGNGPSRVMPGGFDAELAELPPAYKEKSAGNKAPPDTANTESKPPRPRTSTKTLPGPPGSFDGKRSAGKYSPSMYSTNRSLGIETNSQISFSLRDPASYERLIGKPFPTQKPSAPPIIPPRTSSRTSHRPMAAKLINKPQDTCDIGLVPLSLYLEQTDGHLSSAAPSERYPKKPAKSQVSANTISSQTSFGVPHAQQRQQQDQTMEDTVSNTRALMAGAMQLVEDTANKNQNDEVVSVLEEASLALRRASKISGQIQEPLRLSEIELSTSSDDYMIGSSSDIGSEPYSTDRSPRNVLSDDTLPTEYSAGPQSQPSSSIASPVSKNRTKRPVLAQKDSHMSASDSDVSPGTVFEEGPHLENKLRSTLGLPAGLKRLHQEQSADSIVIDFAYRARQPRPLLSGRVPPATGRSQQSKGGPKAEKFVEDIDVDPEDIEQAPFRTQKDREEPLQALKVLPPDPIVEPSEPVAPARGSGPKRRKPRGRIAFEPSQRDKTDRERPTSSSLEAPRSSSAALPPTAVRPNQGPTSGPQVRRVPTELDPEERQATRKLKYKRRPIAREWGATRKRITAVIACINTTLVGLIAGIYAGEVPKIQYQLADMHHRVILGNVVFFLGLGLSTLFTWPLPLLHGRKPYILVALALTLPLQFPQAIAVTQSRSNEPRWYVALLLPRAISGLALGLSHVNSITILFDLFGASLQSHYPHQEIVDGDDVRRQGGGLGLWLGFWAWCFVASLAIGFLIGAGVTANLDPEWGFYLVVIILAAFLLLNVVAPETRRAPHRRSILHFFDEEDNIQKKIAKGEVMLHLSQDGPKHWWEEIWAGIRLMVYMLSQFGFCVLALYLAWIYAMVVLVTLLLGALLSVDYLWLPQYVGLGVFALALGALLAIPLSKANLFSRERSQPPRTDSMTFQPRVTWSSHLVRRCIFTFALPIAGLAFTLTSPGPSLSWSAPVITSAIVGFLATLAIGECVGLTMEAYDTCDLQPGANSKHRLQSLDSVVRRRRTNFSSFPRVIAGLFAAQGFGFFLAAGATGISGSVTRRLGAQAATRVVAGILLLLTILLSVVLWRFRTIQVIPNHAFGTKRGSRDWSAEDDDKYWKAVIVGNPSGKIRRMNLLETGKWSRWTEIRRLNKLVRPGTWEGRR